MSLPFYMPKDWKVLFHVKKDKRNPSKEIFLNEKKILRIF